MKNCWGGVLYTRGFLLNMINPSLPSAVRGGKSVITSLTVEMPVRAEGFWRFEWDS